MDFGLGGGEAKTSAQLNCLWVRNVLQRTCLTLDKIIQFVHLVLCYGC